jgi:hypothetical protein
MVVILQGPPLNPLFTASRLAESTDFTTMAFDMMGMMGKVK